MMNGQSISSGKLDPADEGGKGGIDLFDLNLFILARPLMFVEEGFDSQGRNAYQEASAV